MVLALVLTKKDTTSNQNSQQESRSATEAPASEDRLELQNFGLSAIAPYNKTSGTSGDVAISTDALRDLDRGLKGFYVFGESLEGNRLNPNFEFASVKDGSKIIAAIDGVVSFVKEQPETGDKEVFLQPKANSIWTVGYDHLTNVTVKQGDTVTSGDVLGEAAKQNNGVRRFEIQINKDINGTTTHVCPSTILSPIVKDSLLADLLTLQTAWETFSGKDLYKTESQSVIGCLYQTLTVEQAEGR